MEKTGMGNWKLDHVGVVIRDLDKAVEYYQAFSMGPFNPSGRASFDSMSYGKPAEGIKNLSRHGQMGGLKLELIQPVSGDSMQKRFLEEKGEGVHHLAFTVDNLDEEMAKLAARDFKVIYSAKFVGGGGMAFVDTDKVGGVCFQLIQLPTQ